VTVDFDVRSSVLLAAAVYRQFWEDDRLSGIALFVVPGGDVDAKVNELRSMLAGRAELLVSSNAGCATTRWLSSTALLPSPWRYNCWRPSWPSSASSAR